VRVALSVGLVMAMVAGGGRAVAKDWNRVDDPLKGALGAHVGKIGGTGLSFKFPVQWFLYLQATGLIWHTDENKWHNYGFEAHYLLRQDQTMRLFIVAGIARYYHEKVKQDAENEEEVSWNSGVGVGTEFLIGRRWSLQVDLSFTYESKDRDIMLFPQAGAYFYW
jgi:hypothetical protein